LTDRAFRVGADRFSRSGSIRPGSLCSGQYAKSAFSPLTIQTGPLRFGAQAEAPKKHLHSYVFMPQKVLNITPNPLQGGSKNKKQTLKRLLSTALALTMLIGMVPTQAFAAQETEVYLPEIEIGPGTGNNKLSPKGMASRAQVATMLLRYNAAEQELLRQTMEAEQVSRQTAVSTLSYEKGKARNSTNEMN